MKSREEDMEIEGIHIAVRLGTKAHLLECPVIKLDHSALVMPDEALAV